MSVDYTPEDMRAFREHDPTWAEVEDSYVAETVAFHLWVMQGQVDELEDEALRAELQIVIDNINRALDEARDRALARYFRS